MPTFFFLFKKLFIFEKSKGSLLYLGSYVSSFIQANIVNRKIMWGFFLFITTRLQ